MSRRQLLRIGLIICGLAALSAAVQGSQQGSLITLVTAPVHWGPWNFGSAFSVLKPAPQEVLAFMKPPTGATACVESLPPPTQLQSDFPDRRELVDFVSCYKPRPNTEVWSINRPNVRQPEVAYPSITFKKGDLVSIAAGGCAQRGGAGLTWYRYVNPHGYTHRDETPRWIWSMNGLTLMA